VRRHPTRFIGTATLPMQDIALACAELRRAVFELNAKAVMLPAHVEGAYLGDRCFWPLWETIRNLDIAAFIHPEGLRDPWYQKFALWNSIGQQIEEAKAMASIIYEGLLNAIPGLKIVVAHGGGYFPYCVGRVDRNVDKVEAQINLGDRKPSDYLRDFYYDTCVFDALALKTLFARVGADRILLGADYPVGEPDPIGAVKEAVTLSDEDLQMVAAGTAARILGLNEGTSLPVAKAETEGRR
jgi:aminocarboxymuconate-semialdehyde decarboxylase